MCVCVNVLVFACVSFVCVRLNSFLFVWTCLCIWICPCMFFVVLSLFLLISIDVCWFFMCIFKYMYGSMCMLKYIYIYYVYVYDVILGTILCEKIRVWTW